MFDTFQPPSGGLHRLREKIDLAEASDRNELVLLKVAASVLFLVLLGFGYEQYGTASSFSARSQQQQVAITYEVPLTTPGVRYLWVLSESPAQRAALR